MSDSPGISPWERPRSLPGAGTVGSGEVASRRLAGPQEASPWSPESLT